MSEVSEASPDDDYKVGDKAWIKLPGYPPWPGRIEEPKNIRERKKVRPGYYFVFFYGTHETAIAAKHELHKWNEENNKQWFVERDTIYFTDSLWEVENDPNVKRDAPVPAITKPPDLDNVTKYNPIVPATFSDGEGPDADAVEGDDNKSGSESDDKSGSSSSDGKPSSSSSSSSSSDSDYGHSKKRKKKMTKKKAVEKVKKPKTTSSSSKKQAKPKPTQKKRKTSGSSSDSTVDDVDVSSSSDEDSVLKFKKLTSSAKPPAPRMSAALTPKPAVKTESKPKSPAKTIKEEKGAGSSDEEAAALKKFAAEKKSEHSSSTVKSEGSVASDVTKIKKEDSADEKIVDPVNKDEGNSNLAAFLSESDGESREKTKAEKKSIEAEKKNSSKVSTLSKESSPPKSPKKSPNSKKSSISSSSIKSEAKESDHLKHAVKSDPKAIVVEKKSTSSDKKRSQEKDDDSDSPPAKKREKSPNSSNQLEKKLKKHKERLEKQKLEKERLAEQKERKPLIEESDNSSADEADNRKSKKPTSAIVMDVHKLSSEKVLDKLHFELMKSLTQKNLNHERAITCLTEMKDYLTSESLKKVTDVFISIKKVRKYKKDAAVQQKAEEVFNVMKSLVTNSDTDVLSVLAEEKKKRQSEATKSQVSPAVGPEPSESTNAVAERSENISSTVSGQDSTAPKQEPASSEPTEKVSKTTEQPKVTEQSVTEKASENTSNDQPTEVVEGKQEATESENATGDEVQKALPSSGTKPAVQYFFMRPAEEGAEDDNDNKDPQSVIGDSEAKSEAETSSQASSSSSAEINGHGDKTNNINGSLTPTLDEKDTSESIKTENEIEMKENSNNNASAEEGEILEKPAKSVNPDINIDDALGI